MTGLERVKKAIGGDPVDRIPVSFELVGMTDLKELYFRADRNWKPVRYPPFIFDIDNYEPVTYQKKEDEWGCLWEYGGTVSAAGIVVGHPLLELEALPDYQFPKPAAKGRFEGFDQIIRSYPDCYLYATHLHLLFERLHFLHGFNETLIDLLERRSQMEELLDRILDYDLDLVRALGNKYAGKIQAFASTDDWGTNTSLFIDPKLWREVFKPRYAEIIQEVHRNGFDFWFHSDGKIEEIIPDLIELGVDVFNICDAKLLGIESFGKIFSGKACFTLYVDISYESFQGIEQEIVREAHELVRYWSDCRGSRVLAMDFRDIGGATDETLKLKKLALSAFLDAHQLKTRK
jgi:hypothetical protein